MIEANKQGNLFGWLSEQERVANYHYYHPSYHHQHYPSRQLFSVTNKKTKTKQNTKKTSPFLLVSNIICSSCSKRSQYNARCRVNLLRRSVRSDAQLSCTETRFQKCSQSGKKGSKHKMLLISMACNVSSCKKNPKKHSKNQIRWFYYVNSAPELRNDRKSPKKRITKSRFTQFFV